MFEWAPRATFDLSIPDAGLCEDWWRLLEEEKEPEELKVEEDQTP